MSHEVPCERSRISLVVGAVLLTANLSGCGGDGSSTPLSSNSGSGTGTTSYSIGGTISGLTGAGLALNGGAAGTASPQANAASFTLPTALAAGAKYAVSVTTQPAGQDCQVSNGTGTVGSANVTSVQVGCVSGQWTWVGGSKTANASAVYGTQGTPAATNIPGPRIEAATWIDPSGNLWLFGGWQIEGAVEVELNDLWEYNPSTGQWTWMSGSNASGASGVYGTVGTPAASNVPGARRAGASWTDAMGNLWLFGGYGIDSGGNTGALNDLWKYSPSIGQWTWAGGSSTVNAAGVYGTQGSAAPANVPSAREESVAWTDASGNFFMFGGYSTVPAPGGVLNDLWKYDLSTSEWTWIAGSNTLNASGVYGTKGTAVASNIPGARAQAVAWIDSTGNFWLFGGVGYDSAGISEALNDLWKYSPGSTQWTWVSGSNTAGTPGVYGTLGVAASANGPGPLQGPVTWSDTAGNLWLFGNDGASPNNLWKFSTSAGQWTWMGGVAQVGANSGVYGTLGVAAATNEPGARSGALSWTDSAGHFWLFGGAGYDSAGNQGSLNDLWKYAP